jgi:membrane protease YdiL (CAAX protease family)
LNLGQTAGGIALGSESAPARTIRLGQLTLDARATVVVVASTLLLILDAYHHFIPSSTYAEFLLAKALERTLYYLITPLLIILIFFRQSPSAYGFRLGDWRAGLRWTLIFFAVGLPILYFSARTPTLTSYYAQAERTVTEVLGTSALDLFGWEFLFRGFLLFGLYRVVGPSAIILQAVPFAMAHIGKPELETLSTIFGGILFGWLAWRSKSFLYPFLLHWLINIFVILTAMGIIAWPFSP